MRTWTHPLQARPTAAPAAPAIAWYAVPVAQTRPALTTHGHALLALTLLASILRLHDIALDGFWNNELFSMYWIRNPIHYLVTKGMLIETNPPLHYILLKLWTAVFGADEVGARSLSALASIGCVPLIYALGRTLGGPAVGLVAAGLLALSPVQIYFAHEARCYALLPVFVMLALLGVCRFLDEPAPADRAAHRWRGLVLYGAGAVALLYTHATAPFVIAALGATVLFALIDMKAPAAQIRRFLLANLVVAVLAAPVLVAMALQARSPNIAWMPPFGLDTLLIVARYLMVGPMQRADLGDSGSRILLWTEIVLAAATAIVLFALARGTIRDRRAFALVLVFPALFLLAATAVSLARPILIPRIGIWLSVPASLAAAFILTGHARRKLRLLAGGLMAACIGIGLVNNSLAPAEHKPDWRALLRDNPADAADGPLLVAGRYVGPLGIAFYSGDAVHRPLRHWVPAPDETPTAADLLSRAASGAEPITTQQIVATIRAGRHLRLFLSDTDMVLNEQALSGLPEFATTDRQIYPGLVVLSW
ncbi:glycosyltransferase family 39 protein [Limobrevibacterium gyesilva]|uniref:Glycosyltransferase family 39 protein n=1 Tax=Limobrevibacterium gyesilva TaxID=2991712 RepID=A0AA42CIF5_9PROT|nr:glycosyltransferase family 39 protein [Limobrevibacterium gyesilva]MCW3475835.1 glycosyltransferase family 39 protein [Limobrevibacterium gyesilva]